MPDFTLEPDEIEPERPVRGKPPRLVSTGLHPTAAVPKGRPGQETPPSCAPCVRCGEVVLSGETLQGQTLHLDVAQTCYCVVWANQAPVPTLFESRAYPVHTCREERR